MLQVGANTAKAGALQLNHPSSFECDRRQLCFLLLLPLLLGLQLLLLSALLVDVDNYSMLASAHMIQAPPEGQAPHARVLQSWGPDTQARAPPSTCRRCTGAHANS